MQLESELVTFTDKLKSTASTDEAWLTFDSELKRYGVENALYGFIVGVPKQLSVEETFFHSHEESFFSAYDQGGYMDCDWGPWFVVAKPNLHCGGHLSKFQN